MNCIDEFNTILADYINLNKTRINTLECKVETITTKLKSLQEYGKNYINVTPQGSYRHKTIIKPNKNNDQFDADVVLYLRTIEGWKPSDYIENLYSYFREDGNYKDIVGRKTRCMTIDYAGEFHLDIVPCIVKKGFLFSKDRFYVLNRIEDIEEETDGEGYAAWFTEQNSKTHSDNLIKSIRLFKYLRDIKRTFSAKSGIVDYAYCESS